MSAPLLTRRLRTLRRPLCRCLNLYEYQSKTLLAANGCAVQRFCVLEDGKSEVLDMPDTPQYIVKAQIVGGDRGRGIFTNGFRGGVHLTRSRQEAVEIAQRMLGQVLVTNQTGNRGMRVERVIVAEYFNAFKQTYLCFTLDPIHGPSIYVSDETRNEFDGKDECAKQNGNISVHCVELADKLPDNLIKIITEKLNFGDLFATKVAQEIVKLWSVFTKYHVLYLAINPFILSNTGHLVCLDVKITIDNSALALPHIASVLATGQRDEFAEKINYIELGGNIGCLVEGAGLALVTNDLLSQYGGRPANFAVLNLSKATKDATDHLQIGIAMITGNAKITSILININWYKDCVQIAKALLNGRVNLPIVLRLRGLNEDAAWKLLEPSGLKLYRVNDTEEAARKAIALSDVSLSLEHDTS